MTASVLLTQTRGPSRGASLQVATQFAGPHSTCLLRTSRPWFTCAHQGRLSTRIRPSTMLRSVMMLRGSAR